MSQSYTDQRIEEHDGKTERPRKKYGNIRSITNCLKLSAEELAMQY